MSQIEDDDFIISPDDPVLITGATGFIGPRLVERLLDRGFRNLRCFSRPSSDLRSLEAVASAWREKARIDVVKGNLLSGEDCAAATRDVAVIFHLATGGGEQSFADAVMNSVVTTRNLLEATALHRSIRRFVHVSSFAVYSNQKNPHGRLLDESSPLEERPHLRGEAYGFAKVKQEEIVTEYGRRLKIPYVIVRPGCVYGPGRKEISGRVGISTFGVFLHLGGSNTVPFTYVDNCAEAMALAGLRKGVEGEVFNIVDDDPFSSRQFLRLYKRHVARFKSIYVPHVVSHALCCLWERYSNWSDGQLPPAFNQRRWHAYWKKTRYTNEKVKARLRWTPKVPMAEGFERYFQSCRENGQHA